MLSHRRPFAIARTRQSTLCELVHKTVGLVFLWFCLFFREMKVMLDSIPRDVFVASAVGVGVEVSAIHHHVGSAIVVAMMFALCAVVVVETINDVVG